MRCATVMLKMLKIRNEPTNSVTPPNTSSTTLKKDRSSAMSSDWRWAASWPVSTCTCAGSTRSIRRLSSAGGDALGGGDRDRVELPLLVGEALGLLERQLRGAGAAAVGVAQALEADDLVLAHLTLARDAQRVADLEASRCRPCWCRSRPRRRRRAAGPRRRSSVSKGSGATEETKLGAKPAVSLSPFSSTNWPSEKMPPSALSHALHPAHAVQELGREGGSRASSAAPRVVGRDRHVGALVGLVEDVVEGRVDRVREHVAAGDEGHAEEHGERGDERAQLALREAAQSDALTTPRPSSARSPRRPCPRRVVHHEAVAQHDQTVGVGGRLGVVGDHHHGLAELVDRARAASGGSPRWPSSRGCPWARRRTPRRAATRARAPPPRAAAGRRRARPAGGSGGPAGRRSPPAGRGRPARPRARRSRAAAGCSPAP